jgi:hypothetical protein
MAHTSGAVQPGSGAAKDIPRHRADAVHEIWTMLMMLMTKASSSTSYRIRALPVCSRKIPVRPRQPRHQDGVGQRGRQWPDVSGRTPLCRRCGRGPARGAPSPGRRRPGSLDGLCVDPVKRGIQRVQTDTAAPSGLLGEVRGQRRTILKVSKVIDIDERDDGLAVLGDRDGTVGVPGLGDKFPQVCTSRSQRMASHTSKFTLCSVIRPSIERPNGVPHVPSREVIPS